AECESARLLIDRAAAVDSSFGTDGPEGAALVQICRKLDGIPLALELAAARTRVLSLEQIAARLDDRFNLLTINSLNEPLRHRTLYATIDWSYSQLTPAQRWVFNRLAVFAGGFSLEATQAVCTCDVVQVSRVLDVLADLVDKSLVASAFG